MRDGGEERRDQHPPDAQLLPVMRFCCHPAVTKEPVNLSRTYGSVLLFCLASDGIWK